MNRIRTVKPELFRHLALFEAEEKYQMPLRIAFVGLFTCCDRRWPVFMAAPPLKSRYFTL